jgi:hypothetical protein
VVLLYGAKKEGAVSGWAEFDDDLPPGPVPYDGPIVTEALTLFFSSPRPVASAIARALKQVPHCAKCQRRACLPLTPACRSRLPAAHACLPLTPSQSLDNSVAEMEKRNAVASKGTSARLNMLPA